MTLFLHEYGDDITEGGSSTGKSGSSPSTNGIKYKLCQLINSSVAIYLGLVISIPTHVCTPSSKCRATNYQRYSKNIRSSATLLADGWKFVSRLHLKSPFRKESKFTPELLATSSPAFNCWRLKSPLFTPLIHNSISGRQSTASVAHTIKSFWVSLLFQSKTTNTFALQRH